ncbi:MAG: hypothetical protein NT154_29155 [Verrucomicrobia bacterium]|nr:hypothetical protein [Verrucomicrobiota bacterium]
MNNLFLARLSLLVIAFGPCLSARALIWDDFSTYPNGLQLTQGYLAGPNSPWGRFGAATADNLVAGYIGVGGSMGGDYPVLWSLGNNGNLVYHFPAATNLSAAPGFRVQLRVDVPTPVPTSIVGLFEEANGNIWGTIPALKPVLTNDSFQAFTFHFTPAETELLVAGSGPDFSLADVMNIRIRFENSGASGANHIYIDNFESLPPPPVITRLTRGPADAVQVTFTCPDSVASDFVLERATALGPITLWEPDPNAVIQGIDATTFQADTTSPATAQYFRISR